ncbi:MAG: GerW family sporulation protein [Lachnospiraceae bacterium]|nr:GerW family sporulation protein [Lachnospiraceae bacterium]MDY5741883.1 GerW family sporulation protein [Lachnospiraceae bacterium]
MAGEALFQDTVKGMLDGMNDLISSKTVIGDPVNVGDVTIIPIMEASFAVYAKSNRESGKAKNGGGMGGKLIPTSVLVIKDGTTRLVSIKNQDTISKLLDMAPEVLDRFIPSRRAAKQAEREMAEEVAFANEEHFEEEN